MAVITFAPSSLQLVPNETVTVEWQSDTGLALAWQTSADESVATVAPLQNQGTSGTFSVTGVANGSTTIDINGTTTDMQTITSAPLPVTVGTVEDESYLNKRGLTHFWENIDDLKLDTDGTAYRTAAIPYGQCDNTSTATAFTATVPGITELRDGVCMWLKNGVVTSAAGFTININNLGAKPVYNNMAAATADTTIFNANYTMLFVYDSTRVAGGCWVCYRGYNSDNNTIGYQVRTNSQSLPMTSVVYRYRLLFTSADNEHYVPANNSTSTNATASRTVCQDKINPFGRIFYYSSTASIAANARPGATALWEQYAIALGYSFNRTGAALTLTSWKPVYVKAAPQSDGSAIIDSTTPYVQDLPTTEDGKIYIFLGVAYSATNVELQLDHPVYWYKGGMIRPYTNAPAGISSVAWGDITGTLSNQSDLNTALGAKANSADLAAVATSGSYNDLANKPTVPEIKRRTNASTVIDISPLYVAGDGTSTYPMALKTHGDDRAGSFAYININEPTDSITEAYAGGYVWDQDEDWWRKMSEVRLALYSDIPTVPTVNNATLTIQKNGTSVAAFTANASSNVTANISVPTLYTTTGQNTDGAVTQKLFSDTVGNVETILQTLNDGGGAQ